eukprot:GHRQ01036972.1.p1 GENE.GHRQ01036972.1~~GHRQ01036972.1.p1  ORF type:complete len:204 (-),score=39.55 GHRQ01036972.1:22-633(-)
MLNAARQLAFAAVAGDCISLELQPVQLGATAGHPNKTLLEYNHSTCSCLHAGQQVLLPALAQYARGMASAHPEIQVYAGPQPPKKAVTLRTLRAKYDRKQPICMATAYDYPSAVHVSARCACCSHQQQQYGRQQNLAVHEAAQGSHLQPPQSTMHRATSCSRNTAAQGAASSSAGAAAAAHRPTQTRCSRRRLTAAAVWFKRH